VCGVSNIHRVEDLLHWQRGNSRRVRVRLTDYPPCYHPSTSAHWEDRATPYQILCLFDWFLVQLGPYPSRLCSGYDRGRLIQGIALETEQVCDGHGLKPCRCVAFQGVNTGRRFYMCSIENVSSFPVCAGICDVSRCAYMWALLLLVLVVEMSSVTASISDWNELCLWIIVWFSTEFSSFTMENPAGWQIVVYWISLMDTVWLFMQEVTNCGFVSWVDAEWPIQLQNALGKILIWGGLRTPPPQDRQVARKGQWQELELKPSMIRWICS
jgi:hypothetical protein